MTSLVSPVGRPEAMGVEVECSYVETLAARLPPGDGD